MKKLILFFAMLMLSVNVFANTDNRSCTVYNAGDVSAKLKNSTDDVGGTGYVYVDIELSAPAPRKIEVVVNVYDLATGTYIDMVTVYIGQGGEKGSQSIHVGTKYSKVYFEINRASCA